MRPKQAQDWITTEWLNSERPLRLDDLRGRVVVLYAFQMLCPGCASQALPQARRVHETFRANDVAVIGLHTVFEHHEGNSPAALKAFLHEYGLAFPVGIDAPGEGSPIPRTMSAYAMQGTPTLILIDREGRLRRQTFGHLPDLQLGAEIMSLVLEPKTSA